MNRINVFFPSLQTVFTFKYKPWPHRANSCKCIFCLRFQSCYLTADVVHNFSNTSLVFSERHCNLLQELLPSVLTPNTFLQLSVWNEAFLFYVFSICSVSPLSKDHHRSVESDTALTNFEHFLCGEHLVPEKMKFYFSDGCRKMSGFNPPVRAAYFLSFMPAHRRWMLPGSHGIDVASALPKLVWISETLQVTKGSLFLATFLQDLKEQAWFFLSLSNPKFLPERRKTLTAKEPVGNFGTECFQFCITGQPAGANWAGAATVWRWIPSHRRLAGICGVTSFIWRC